MRRLGVAFSCGRLVLEEGGSIDHLIDSLDDAHKRNMFCLIARKEGVHTPKIARKTDYRNKNFDRQKKSGELITVPP